MLDWHEVALKNAQSSNKFFNATVSSSELFSRRKESVLLSQHISSTIFFSIKETQYRTFKFNQLIYSFRLFSAETPMRGAQFE